MSQVKADTITDKAGTGQPSFPNGLANKLPTIQKFLSGSGTYTRPAGVNWIRVRMIGGGGGGGGGGNPSGPPGTGTNGADTTFDSTLLVAGHGFLGNIQGNTGGAGGTNSYTAGPLILADINGGSGSGGVPTSGSFTQMGGPGGSGTFGGGGGGGEVAGNGDDASPNSGGGGGGGSSGSTNTYYTGGGGGSGGYLEAIITAPNASYSYSVGAGGTGGAASGSGTPGSGGNGASGVIIIEEYYS